RSLQQHGDNALAMTRELAVQSGPAPASHDAVFFNPLGIALATWPVPWNPILLVIALALWAALAVRLVRRGMRKGAAAGAGVLVLATLALLAGLGWMLHLLLRFLGAMPAMWTAQGGVLVAAF